MRYDIRPCTRHDVDVLADTIRRSFRDVAERFGLTKENCPRHPSNCSEEWIQQELDRGVIYFVIQNDELVSGCVALERANSDVCYLERLGVLPDQRRRGFGKALVSHVLSEAKFLGAHQVSIGIIAEDTDLKAWYKKLGFVETEDKEFPHLPFRVTFMAREVNRDCRQQNGSSNSTQR